MIIIPMTEIKWSLKGIKYLSLVPTSSKWPGCLLTQIALPSRLDYLSNMHCYALDARDIKMRQIIIAHENVVIEMCIGDYEENKEDTYPLWGFSKSEKAT